MNPGFTICKFRRRVESLALVHWEQTKEFRTLDFGSESGSGVLLLRVILRLRSLRSFFDLLLLLQIIQEQ